MLISSNLNKLKYESNKILPKDEMNKLNKDSIVKTDKIYKIYDNQIIFKIGKVDKKKVEEYKRFFLIKRVEYINSLLVCYDISISGL